MSKGKYRITITNTDTGKVLVDEETPAVFAVAGVKEPEAFTGMQGCSVMEVLNLLWAADSARDNILNDYPILKAGYALRDKLVSKTVVADVTALTDLK